MNNLENNRWPEALEFDADLHAYTIKGVPYASVTQILTSAKLVDFSSVDPDVLEFASERGTAVHAAIELDIKVELDEWSLDQEAIPYFEAWKRFKVDCSLETEYLETLIANPKERYAGALDWAGLLNGRRAIIDWKTVATMSKVIGIQTAAYKDLLCQIDPLYKDAKRYGLQLRRDKTYRLCEYSSPLDAPAFQGAKIINTWRTHA